MNVDEFLSDLYADSLSDLFIANRNSKEEPRAKLFPIMNTAMLQAYAKHQIAFDTVQQVTTADTAVYILPDVADEILGINRVINVYGRTLTTDEVVILGKTLTFIDPANDEYQIEYKTKPVRFTIAQDDALTELVLPDLLIPWMSCWVAGKVYMSKKDEASVAMATQLMSTANMYEQVYASTNTTNEYTNQDTYKLYGRGFA